MDVAFQQRKQEWHTCACRNQIQESRLSRKIKIKIHNRLLKVVCFVNYLSVLEHVHDEDRGE